MELGRFLLRMSPTMRLWIEISRSWQQCTEGGAMSSETTIGLEASDVILSQGIDQRPQKADRDFIGEAAEKLEQAGPREVLEWAFDRFGDSVTLATGFGAEGVALIDMAVAVNPRTDIFFLDTGFLFPETYELRGRIQDRYGIRIRSVATTLTTERQRELYGPRLWESDPDLCCRLRKLEPLCRALDGFDAWMTAIRRDQSPDRALARAVEWDSRWNLIKINPLVGWSRADVWRYVVRNGLPYNPLHDRGYPSIGCTHCTEPVGLGEHERSGRWKGRNKTECGLHAGPVCFESGTRDVARGTT